MTSILRETMPGSCNEVALRWRVAAQSLYVSLGWTRPHPAVLKEGFDRLERELGAIRAWGDPMALALGRAFKPARHDLADPSPDRRDLLAVLRLSWALATGDAAALVPGDAPAPGVEEAWLDAGLPPSVPCPGASPVAGHGAGSLPFAFAWDRDVGGRPVPTLATGAVAFRHVADADAPVVALLRAASGPPMAVRHVDGLLFRAMLAPGGREPLDLEGFAVAAKGGQPWADDPFSEAPQAGSLLALRHRALPWPGRGPSRTLAGEVAAKAAALASAGPFVVVDGIVHRRCPEPTLHLSFEGRGGAALSWAVGRQVDGDSDMGPLRLMRDHRRPLAPPYGDPDPCLSVPLSSARLAGEFLGRLAAALGLPDPAHPPDGPAWEVLRPDLLTPDPGLPYEALAGWARMADPDGEDPASDAFAAAMSEAAAEARAGRVPPAVPDAAPFTPAAHVARLATASYGPLAALAAGDLDPVDDDIADFMP